MLNKNSRPASFVWIILMYLLALAAAVLVYRYFQGAGMLAATFIADVAATLVIWLFGVAFNNASTYDPYWSVAPVAIVAFWAIGRGAVSFSDILFLSLLFIWGVRLTANWARRWHGLGHQDWRYSMYQQNNPRLWFIINLFGINLMPTVLVYLAMIPVFKGIYLDGPANIVTAAGMLVSLGAIALELLSDAQMDTYRRRPEPKSPSIDEGLWRWCRHPNYLGEILFWWGLWLMQMSVAPLLWTVAGPIAITLLFVFVSVPMMEKHVLEARPEYSRTIQEVPMLLPLGAFTTGRVVRKAEPR